MKILHVQESLSRGLGGPSAVLPQLANAQAVAGNEVVVATTNADYPGGFYHKPGWDSIEGGPAQVFYAPVQFHPLRISLGLAAYLRAAIPNFDIVHVHGLYRFPVTAAAYMSRRYNVPYIIRPHGALDPYMHSRSKAGKIRLKRLYENWFDLPNLHGAAAIHYTAERERDRAEFLNLRSPSFVIPNALESHWHQSQPERGRLRDRWGVGEAPIVLFLGRLTVGKGLDLLVPAFDAVRQIMPNSRLIIAGPDVEGYGDVVRSWVSERGLGQSVQIVGPLQGLDVKQAYVDADVLAQTSHTENFGMTIVEAMACALPVVISDQVGIHNEISRTGAGLVTSCNTDDISRALIMLLGDPKRRHSMGCAGRDLVQQRYSWPLVVDALDAKYQDIIGSRSGGRLG